MEEIERGGGGGVRIQKSTKRVPRMEKNFTRISITALVGIE
jgi:hypothetical protein